MFIDVHAHVYRKMGIKQDGGVFFMDPEELLRRHDELGIERACILPLIGPECYLPQSNEDILDIARASNGRLIPFCNLDPRGLDNSPTSPFDYWLTYYRDQGCKGIGEFMPNLAFGDPRVQNFFQHAESVGLPLTFDISPRLGGRYGLYDEVGLPQLEASLRRFPKLVILGHGPAFWAEMGILETPNDRDGYPPYPIHQEGVVPKLFRRYPNLYGDLSAGSGYNALARDPGHAVKFIHEFQDRLLFGTDLCFKEQPARIVPFLLELRQSGKISEAIFRKLAKENAVKLLGL